MNRLGRMYHQNRDFQYYYRFPPPKPQNIVGV